MRIIKFKYVLQVLKLMS